jgi:hypothetical protein
MPSPPKRPGPYIIAFLIIILLILAAWLDHALSSPELQEAIRKQKQKAAPVSPHTP